MTTAMPNLQFLTIKKENIKMTKNELELINLIRNSEQPEKVAEYMLNLFLDYLQTTVPSQETHVAAHQETT